jgi:hypothetical protein
LTFTNGHALLHFRYKVGQRFGRHIDECVNLGDGKRTYYTLLVYLSGCPSEPKSKFKNDSNKPTDSSFDPLVGGETVFYGPRNSIVAEVIISVDCEISVDNILFILKMSLNFHLLQNLEYGYML